MRKYLIPVAVVLAWSIALAALSVFDSTDAERDSKAASLEQAALKKR
jgi:hypothetical protein